MKDLHLLIVGVFFIIMFFNNNHYLDFLCPEGWECNKPENEKPNKGED